jgi:AcrR family transcriptional regulator
VGAEDGRKGRILAAAEKLFRHYGPQKTSIADIARAASCAVGSVYLDFPSKEAILAEIAARRQAAVAQAMRAAARGGGSPPARMAAMLEARTAELFRLAAEGAHASDLVRCGDDEEGACVDSPLDREVKRTAREAAFFGWGFGAPVREVLVEVVREGATAGSFDGSVAAETVVAVVERAFATLSPPWIFRQAEVDAMRATRALAAMLLHGILARTPVPRGTRRTSVHVRVRRTS